MRDDFMDIFRQVYESAQALHRRKETAGGHQDPDQNADTIAQVGKRRTDIPPSNQSTANQSTANQSTANQSTTNQSTANQSTTNKSTAN
ncbi:hypothetical protein KCU67_g5641, partial [Aureobasidium melanogenum]